MMSTAAADALRADHRSKPAQYPYLVVPDLTLAGAAGNPRTQRLVLYALAVGALVIVPSLVVLFRVFRRSKGEGDERRP